MKYINPFDDDHTVIDSSFIGYFKLGDNLQLSFETLALFYQQYNRGNDDEKKALHKPIIIYIAIIAEALLYDFFFKARGFTREGIGDISKAVLERVRGKKVDKFETFISVAKRYKFLGPKDTGVYEDLHHLRKLRNRVHIYLDEGFDRDDYKVYNNRNKLIAEKTLEKLMRHMEQEHARKRRGVDDFVLPWRTHFPEIED